MSAAGLVVPGGTRHIIEGSSLGETKAVQRLKSEGDPETRTQKDSLPVESNDACTLKINRVHCFTMRDYW